jgi:hypothetical protein
MTRLEQPDERGNFESGKTWKGIAKEFRDRTEGAVTQRGNRVLGLKRRDSHGSG